jgi:ribonuclease HII
MTSVRDPSKYPTLQFEQNLWKAGFNRIAGIDEAGRGAWAGPVCAAAVILPPDPTLIRSLAQVRDSKLMTPNAREAWAPRIQSAALAWGVGFASWQEIDSLGILPATKLAATRALLSPDPGRLTIDNLSPAALPPSTLIPDYLLTDYLLFPNIDLPQTALVKGDRLSLSVAAASVLAKTARDALMRELDDQYPAYGFARHKGYGTRLHQDAIRRLGLCEIHRRSFSISV